MADDKTPNEKIRKTPQGQYIPEEQADPPKPGYARSALEIIQSSLSDPIARYGQLVPSNHVPISTKVKMLKDPIIAMCTGFIAATLVRAKRVVECKDEAKQRFFEAMFRSWEQEYVSQAAVGIALGSVGLLKKWKFQTPKTIRVGEPPVWKGRSSPAIIDGFDILPPLGTEPRFSDEGRTFKGIKSGGDTYNAFDSLWLTFRKSFAFGDYMGAGRLDQAYKAWWLGQFSQDLYVVAMQREADRVVSVGYPPGKDQKSGKSNQDIAIDIGNSVRSGATVAMPTSRYIQRNIEDGSEQVTNVQKWTIDYLEGVASFDKFHQMDDQHDRRKALGLFVPPQTFLNVKQTALGGPTTSDVLAELAEELLMMDAADLDRHTNEYVIPPIDRANFPDGSAEVRVRTEGLESDNIEQINDIVRGLMGQHPDTAYFDMREAMQRLNLPLLSEEEVERREQEAAERASQAQGDQEQARGGEGEGGRGEDLAQSGNEALAGAEGDRGPVGDPLDPWSDDRVVDISPADVAAALVEWEKLAPEEAKGLLTALSDSS
jgi:hypothetical protein